MTSRVVVVSSEASLMEAANILFDNRVRGLPVVDPERRVVGLLTDHDFITKGSALHLPTLMKLIGHLDIYWKDKDLIRKNLKDIFSIRVGDVMERNPPTISENDSIDNLLSIFSRHQGVSPIAVVDDRLRLVGVVSRYDIIKLYARRSRSSSLSNTGQEATDREVDEFVKNFERNFVAVSRFRARHWFLLGLVFVLVGFLAALAFFFNIQININ